MNNRRIAWAVALCLAFGCTSPSVVEDINQGWLFWEEGQPAQTVMLPHDAMIHTQRSADVPRGSSTGFYRGGKFHYEKTFRLTAAEAAKHISFHFGGVYMRSQVYVNGTLAGGIPYGYSDFTVVADGLVHAGENVLRVDTDNAAMEDSRWYSGAGIYRPVTMRIQDPVYIKSVHATTLSHDPALVRVETLHDTGDVKVEILYDGAVVASGEGDSVDLTVPDARLWSDETPFLYTVRATLSENGRVKDVREESFGIRTLAWNVREGLLVNGKPTLLKGGCFHADNGILGMAEWDDAAERRVRILKSYGFNAVRSAHHPISEAMMKACDKYGMYIMDELWDMWFRPKNKNDYGNYFMEHYHEDIRAIVEKDWNHPSVIMYSIGNEVSEPVLEGGMEVAYDIVANLRALDPYRATTSGINLAFLGPRGMGGMFGGAPRRREEPKKPEQEKPEQEKPAAVNMSLIFNEAAQEGGGKIGERVLSDEIDLATTPILDATDIAGYNYAVARYKLEATKHPDRVIVGSETYPPDIYTSWQLVKELPYVVGDFMWTAWDYLGEVGAGGWTYEGEGTGFTKPYPWRYANSGAIDVTGHPTSEVYLATVAWEDKPGKPWLGVRPVREDPVVGRSIWRRSNAIPSWSWRGREGINAVVEVYSSAERVELWLNGKKLEEGAPKDGVIMFKFPYEAGKLEARAYVGDTCCGTDVLETATGDLRIAVRPEIQEVQKGHLVFVDIDLEGENGVVESAQDQKLSVTVEGGQLLAFGSARAISEERFDTGSHTTYYGRTQAVVYADKPGTIRITASGEGFAPQTATVKCVK